MPSGVKRAVSGAGAAGAIALTAVLALAQAPAGTAVYEGARLIIGDARPPIENGAIVVQGGRITAVGVKGAVPVPAGAAHVDLTGKTVMPAMVNAHVHIGYEGYSSWGAANYTPQNVLDHLQREAFYGVGATQSVGSSPTDQALKFQQDQQAGKFPPASRFFFMPGMAPPNGGPDAVLRVATTALHVVNEVTTPQEARAAVQAMAARHIASVKIWVDDRRGTYPKLSPEVVRAIIEEAHAHKMSVNAHATTLPDQKEVVRDGADVLVHLVQGEKLDDEYLALLKEKKPVLGDGDWARRSHRGMRTRSVLRGIAAGDAGGGDSGDDRAEAAGAVLRTGVAQRREARGDRRLQLPENDRVWRADCARHRHRPAPGSYLRDR